MTVQTGVIAVDAMGGDRAPEPIIAGVLEAIRHDGRSVALFGRSDAITPLLRGVEYPKDRLSVVHCPDMVAMTTKPAQAMRQSESSMARVFRCVKEGGAVAGLTAGNSGAAMALALRYLGRIPGVIRPAICATLPGVPGPRLFLDAGANTECSPEMLAQFGVMGALLAEAVLRIDNPRVAVLSNGEEEGKGNELTRASYELLEAAPINFIGYCEGNDLFQAGVDVIVADGFTGNIAIKTIEGTARFVSGALRQELGSTWLSQVGAVLASNALKGLKAILDPRQYGGAPLLGLSAPAIVAHGSADAVAIRSALRVAADCAGRDLAEQIKAALSA